MELRAVCFLHRTLVLVGRLSKQTGCHVTHPSADPGNRPREPGSWRSAWQCEQESSAPFNHGTERATGRRGHFILQAQGCTPSSTFTASSQCTTNQGPSVQKPMFMEAFSHSNHMPPETCCLTGKPWSGGPGTSHSANWGFKRLILTEP